MQTGEESPASPTDMADTRPVMKRGADSAVDIELEGIMGRLGNLQHSDPNEQITKFVEVIGCSYDEAKASPSAPPGSTDLSITARAAPPPRSFTWRAPSTTSSEPSRCTCSCGTAAAA